MQALRGQMTVGLAYENVSSEKSMHRSQPQRGGATGFRCGSNRILFLAS